jgi:predicted transcriptional regulator
MTPIFSHILVDLSRKSRYNVGVVERFIEVDGAKLRELRRRRMLSLRELGERSGVAFDNINKLENEKHRAQPRTLRKLAEVLGVEPHELMKGEE